jgi:hypothetical protein
MAMPMETSVMGCPQGCDGAVSVMPTETGSQVEGSAAEAAVQELKKAAEGN